MAKHYFCKECKYIGPAVTSNSGYQWLALCLLLACPPLGVVWLVYLLTTAKKQCKACGHEGLTRSYTKRSGLFFFIGG